MSEHPDDAQESPDGRSSPPTDPVESVEAYRDDGTVVLYDAENPLAWVETSAAVTLSEHT